MNDMIELRRVFGALTRRWWLVLLFTGLAAAIGYFVSKNMTPVYLATTSVIVGSLNETLADNAIGLALCRGVVASQGVLGTTTAGWKVGPEVAGALVGLVQGFAANHTFAQSVCGVALGALATDVTHSIQVYINCPWFS